MEWKFIPNQLTHTSYMITFPSNTEWQIHKTKQNAVPFVKWRNYPLPFRSFQKDKNYPCLWQPLTNNNIVSSEKMSVSFISLPIPVLILIPWSFSSFQILYGFLLLPSCLSMSHCVSLCCGSACMDAPTFHYRRRNWKTRNGSLLYLLNGKLRSENSTLIDFYFFPSKITKWFIWWCCMM